MKLKMYSIYDLAAKAYVQPFFMHNDGLAIRAFQDNVNDAGSQMNKHPEQFQLFRVGEWDDSIAKVSGSDAVCIAHANELKNPDEISELKHYTDKLAELVQAIESEIQLLEVE